MASFFRRILSHFGFFKEDSNKDNAASSAPALASRPAATRERRPVRPVVSECTPGSGGVQGLQWYADKLMMDEDGDVAQEFLGEVSPEANSNGIQHASNFEVKPPAGPVKLKGPICTSNGNVHQYIESSSGVHWS